MLYSTWADTVKALVKANVLSIFTCFNIEESFDDCGPIGAAIRNGSTLFRVSDQRRRDDDADTVVHDVRGGV